MNSGTLVTPVALTNRTPRTVGGEAVLSVPSGWDLSVPSRSFKLKPGESKNLDFIFTDIRPDPLRDLIVVKCVTEEETLTTQLKPIPCFHTRTRVVIDGDLSD